MIELIDLKPSETPQCHSRQYSPGASLIVAVNDDRVLESTLLASPSIQENCQVIVRRGFQSAASAYNSGLNEANEEILLFAHQDVFLPSGWFVDLDRALVHLEKVDPKWGVLGVFGVKQSKQAGFAGHCYSTGLRSILGSPFEVPIEAQSLDELLLVLRRSSGLAFDESLPGFHLYGTDICLQAKQLGMKNYIIPAFCIHNSNGITRLPKDFWRAYFYLRRKWWQQLPVVTCCTALTRSAFPAIKSIVHGCFSAVLPSRNLGQRADDVAKLYDSLTRQMQLR